MTEIGRYFWSLFITPRVRDISLAIFEESIFEVSPRKLNVVTFSIFVSQIIKSGITFEEITFWLLIMEYHEFSFLNI